MEKNKTIEIGNAEEMELFPSSSRQDELKSDLKIFGLEESEILMYLGLLRTGPVTVGSMATTLGIDRAKIYRSLTKLRNEGLVTTSFSNPTICTPREPGEALQTIIDKNQDDLFTMQKLASKITSVLSKLGTEYEGHIESYFSVIQSRAVIYSKIGKVLQDSKNGVVYIVTTGIDLTRMYYTPIPEKIRHATKNGTVVRILTESNIDRKILAIVRKFGATEVRKIDLPSRGRIMVRKECQLIMSNGSGASLDLNNSEDAAIYTNSTAIIQNIWALCEHLWTASKEI